MYKNIIFRRLEKYRKENDISDIDQAFLEFINDMFFNVNTESDISECIVDGQSDKQIDLIQIEEGDILTIRILQVKKTKGFESNIVILLKNGLEWIFNRSDEDVIKLKNIAFKNKILEVRDILSDYNLKNVYIDVVYVTLGDTSDILPEDEINTEIAAINNIYNNKFENFKFKLYGAKDIYDHLEARSNINVDANLEIIYDVNKPSIILNEFNGVKSIACNVKAKELIKIFSDPSSEYLFEQNIRKYLDEKSKVNTNIIDTASSDAMSEYFSILNNGVTIICDEYEVKSIGSSTNIVMKNIQIINGCQTIMSLYRAFEKNKLNENVSLMLRIHQTKDCELIDKIIIATNDQNPVNSRDLISNTVEQIELQKYFYEVYGIAYQRKRNDFKDVRGNNLSKKDLIPNDKVGQVALACIKARPHLALSSKGQVFNKHVDVFSKNKDCIVLSWLIYENVLKVAKLNKIKSDPELSSIIKFGRFHITYLIYKNIVQKDNQAINLKLQSKEDNLNDEIVEIVMKLKENLNSESKNNLLAYFKNKDSFEAIKDIDAKEIFEVCLQK
ncbi:AIPR family protein [Clostridium perfringens]|nr:hypothetical protein CYK70_06485 [Clostridium perfringens]